MTHILVPRKVLQDAVAALKWNSSHEVSLLGQLQALLNAPIEPLMEVTAKKAFAGEIAIEINSHVKDSK